MHTKISHSGIIESIAEDCVKVRILQTSACAACKVAGHCNASESKEKIVDVLNVSDTSGMKVGDPVVVCASRDVANRALLLGFGIPFLLLVSVLITALRLTSEEGWAAIAALLSLVPYYGVLYLFRNKIRQRLSFYIE
ncbi:MAG: SoxR reducing system RseC family protein [Prevotella sp.]|nr:SoxR reducing system RseC family protein [Prevotella sp.]